jgi:hypothetical protein
VGVRVFAAVAAEAEGAADAGAAVELGGATEPVIAPEPCIAGCGVADDWAAGDRMAGAEAGADTRVAAGPGVSVAAADAGVADRGIAGDD